MLPLLLLVGQAWALPGAPQQKLSLEELDKTLWSLVLARVSPSQSTGGHWEGGPSVQDLRRKIEQFDPVEISADTSSLTDEEVKVLDLLIKAARLMDPIYNRQVWSGYEELRQNLASDPSELSQVKLKYLDIMRGPWDRQDDNKPFAVNFRKPLGAGFYPEDLDEDKWENYIEKNPEQASRLNDLATMVERREDGEMVARNYSQVFHEYLEPARNLMIEAADITDNDSLRRFLISRGDAFLSNDYSPSDKDWVDLASKIEITIGPYEFYEDNLKGQKAAFEAYITIADPEESQRLSQYLEFLPEMEQNLPIPDEMKSVHEPERPIRVVDLVFSSGEARKSPQRIAFLLPNDKRVRKETGSKKVLLRNSIEAKFRGVLQPIANILMKKKQLSQNLLSPVAFFNIVLFHGLSHSLGPAFVGNDESNGEVSEALGAFHRGLEEAKADVMGIYNILFMIEKGHLPKDMTNKVLFTYIAALFLDVRDGVTEAYAKGSALQLNRFLEERSILFLPNEETYQVNFNKLIASVKTLVRDIITWQYNGDKAAVEEVFYKYGKLDQTSLNSLDKLTDVALDIRPCYPLAGEDCSGATKY